MVKEQENAKPSGEKEYSDKYGLNWKIKYSTRHESL